MKRTWPIQVFLLTALFPLPSSAQNQAGANSWQEASSKFVEDMASKRFRDARLLVLQNKRLASLPLEHSRRDGSSKSTALHYVGFFPDKTTTVFLLQQGANPNVKDSSGTPPLHCAVFVGQNRDVVRALIEGGADVNAGDGQGATPLMQAVRNRDEPMIRLLVAKKARVNAKDKEGSTALHIAAQVGAKQVCQLLLSLGASKKAKDSRGHTPAEKAQMNNQATTAALLR